MATNCSRRKIRDRIELADSEKRESAAAKNLVQSREELARTTAKAGGAQRSFNVALEKLGVAEKGSREDILRVVEAREQQLKSLRDLQSEQRNRIKALQEEINLEQVRRSSIKAGGTDLTQLRKAIDGENDLLNVINQKISAVDRASSSHREYSKTVIHADRHTKTLGDTINSTGGSIATLDNRLRGIALLLLFSFAQQLITGLIGLGGALVAVSGSAAMAGAAIAGGLAAGLAQSIPIVGLLIGALARLKSVMDVVDAAQKLEQAQFTKSGAASKAAADRADALTSAQDRLTDAQENLGRVRKQAERDLQDLILAEKSAELAARGAVLSQAEAQEALRRATQTGDVEGIARAELSVIESQVRSEEALTRARRARQDVRSAGGNINNLPNVKSATDAVEDASRALEKAQRNVDTTSGSIDTAAQNLAYLLSQLSPAERELYKSVTRIRNTYKELWRPVTDIIIESFTGAVDKINTVMQMPSVLATGKRVATAIGTSIDRLSSFFTSDKIVAQMERIADAGAKNIPAVTSLIEKLGSIFLNVAEAAGPALTLFLDFLNTLADRLLKTTEDGEGLVDFFISGEKHLESWINLFISLIGLFAALTGAGGAKSGKTLIDDATAGIEEFTDKINESPEKVAKFFEDARHIANEFMRVMIALAKELGLIFDPKGAENFADILIEVWIPALGEVIRTIGGVIDTMSRMINNPVIAEVGKWVLAFLIFSQVAQSTVAAIFYLGSVVANVVRGIGFLGKMFLRTGAGASLAYKAFWAVSRILTVLTGPIGLAIGAFVLLLAKLGLLDDVARAVGGFFLGIWEEVRPSVSRLAASVNKLFDALEKGSGAFAVLRPVLKLLIDISAVFLRVFGRTIGRILGGVIDSLSGFVDFITAVLTGDIRGAFNGLVKMFRGLARTLTAPFRGIGEAIIGGITAGLGSLGGKIIGFFKGAINRVKKFLGIKSPSSVFKDIGSAMVDGIVSAFKALPKLILGVLGGLVSKAVDLASDAFGAAKDFIGGIFGGGKDDKPGKTFTRIDKPKVDVERSLGNSAGKTSKKEAELVADAWRSMRNSARRGSTYIEEQYRDMRVATTRTMTRLFRDHRELWGDTERSGKRHAANLHRGVRGSFDALQDVVYDGMKYVASTTNKALKAFDADVVRVTFSPPGKRGAQKAATGGTMGWVGSPGQRGKDKVLALLGKGEVVLNHWQQKALNHMLPEQHTVQSALSQVGYHAGGPEQPGMAVGGNVGKNIGKVNVDGARPGFAVWMQLFRRLFGRDIYVMSGFRSNSTVAGSGRRSNHADRNAIDISNPRTAGATEANPPPRTGLHRLHPFIKRKIPYLDLLWQTMTGGNHYNHIHWGAPPAITNTMAAARKAISNLGGNLLEGLGDFATEVKMPKIGGKGSLRNLAASSIRKAVRAANRKLEDAMGDVEGQDGPDVKLGRGGAGKKIFDFFRRAGFSANQAAAWVGNFQQESGLNPGAVQPGGPGRGLAQWGGNRFTALQAYAKRRGTSWQNMETQLNFVLHELRGSERSAARSIRSSKTLADAVNAIGRDYERFGISGNRLGPAREALRVYGGNEYAKGGEVPGQPGRAVGAIVHAGEWILNKFQQSRLASMLGTNPSSLRSMLGFHGAGGAKGFAGGSGNPVRDEEEVLARTGTTAEQKRRLRQIGKGFYELPSFAIENWSDLLKEVQRAFRAISQGARKIKDKVKQDDAKSDVIDEIIKEGGLIDQMEIARTKFGSQLARRLLLLSFKFDKSTRTVSQQGDAISRAGDALSVAQQEIDKTIGQKGVIERTLNRVNSELTRLRRGGVDKKESSRVRRLVTQQARLNEQLESISDVYGQQVEGIFNAQEAVHQSVIDSINTAAERLTGRLDRVRRVGSAIGSVDLVQNANREQREVLSAQAAQLEAQIAAARNRGNNELANQLSDQVEDLRVQVFELIHQEIRDGVEAVNKLAQRKLASIDLGNRLFDALGTVGLSTASAAVGGLSRSSLFESRGNVLREQQAGLQSSLSAAAAAGNMGLVEELTDALAELHVAVIENTSAYFDARFADVNARAGFSNQVNDLNKQILELEGAISGSVNNAALLSLAQQRTATLQNQRAELQALLNEARSVGNEQDVNDLTVAMLENQVAILQNTQAINELNGTVTDPQTFSSSAWQLFRNAIFNGNTGLLPQYAVPSAATSGQIAAKGASTLMPSSVGGGSSTSDSVQYNDIDVNLSHPVEDVSGIEIGNRVAWSIKTDTTAR